MTSKKYNPEFLSRQGEINAWVLTFLAVGGIYVLSLRTAVPSWAWFLVYILAFSAVSISLGNWMDRNTSIEITDQSITFRNSLRKVQMVWHEIVEVEVMPARWGKTVQVLANKQFFSFNTYGEMKFRDEVKSKTGFLEGDDILRQILERSNLTNQIEAKANKQIYRRP